MERARRASAAAAHAAWEALRGRARAVPDDPLGADDVDVVDGDDEIVVEDGRGQPTSARHEAGGRLVHRDAE